MPRVAQTKITFPLLPHQKRRTDLLAAKLLPFRHRFFHLGRLQILEFVAATQLDKPTEHRFERLNVIAGFAQDKQVISATGGLDHDQQQPIPAELLVEVAR
jgi:hypothetical protein